MDFLSGNLLGNSGKVKASLQLSIAKILTRAGSGQWNLLRGG